eukprot:tig00000498_g1617.t1
MAFMLEIQCQKCQDDYKSKPEDVDNLLLWGQCLMELCMFKSGEEANTLIQEAVERLEQAAILKPNNAQTLASLAQAYNMMGFNNQDRDVANKFFKISVEKMQEACDAAPENADLKKTLANLKRAPEVHEQLLKTMAASGPPGASAPSSSSSAGPRAAAGGRGGDARGAKKKSKVEGVYDFFGYVVVGAAILYMLRRATSQPQ